MYIYCITNLINNKQYVGMTKNPIDESRNYYGSGKLIKRAINKYGIHNFKKEILEICTTHEQLTSKEIYWISKINTKVPIGYNLTDGGEGLLNPSAETRLKMSNSLKGKMVGDKNPFYGKSHTSKTREKIAVKLRNHANVIDKNRNSFRIDMSDEGYINGEYKPANTGWEHTDESKRKMSEAHQKNPCHYWAGKTRSESTKKKISESLMGNTHTDEHKKSITGEGNPFYGKTHSDETKEKMSMSKKNKTPKQKLERYIKFYISRCGCEPSQDKIDIQYKKYLEVV